MKKYFYKLLVKYFSFHIRESDSFVEINGQGDYLFDNILAADKSKYRIVAGVESKDDTSKSLQEVLHKQADYLILNGNIHYERDIQLPA